MRRFLQLALTLALLATLAPALHAQAHSKRLILKDGSYQAVREWQTKGDRIRYFSTERYEWEEIPNSLIDWPATEKYNSGLREPDTVAAREADAEEKAEREREKAAQPDVAPGLHLPATGGVFLLDTFGGQQQLVELVQNGGEINQNKTQNMIRSTINPLASTKQSIELRGLHAQVQAHLEQPTFFANVDQNTDSSGAEAIAKNAAGKEGRPDLDQQEGRYRLVRVGSTKGARVVGNVKISITGTTSEETKFIASKTEPVSGGWVKITPQERLAPGEYALVEMLGPKEMNLYVWDFGVNPNAPQNPTAWKPTQPTPSRTGSDESPLLNKRPKQ
jgi:hypothetical protein